MDKKGRRSKATVLKRYKAVTRSNYEPDGDAWRFRDGQRDVMSIVDVYRLIENQEPRSVFELSIFAHAWEQGPVLVDSYDDEKYKDPSGGTVYITDGARDPDDKDARLKDFDPINRDLPKFQSAFNPAAAIRNWGCLHTDRDVDLFKILFRHKDYKSSGMKDELELVLSIPADLESKLWNRLTVEHGKLTITFGNLRRYFHRELANCYTALAAKGAKVKAYGGAPGNGSDLGRSGAAPMFIVNSPGHNKQIIDFHRKYLDVNFDDASYAEYPPEERPFAKNS